MSAYIIAIEGTDGSGKETQATLLYHALSNMGYKTELLHFPDYDNKSSCLVKEYLAGSFGKDLCPEAICDIFALDRYLSYMNEWKDYYEFADVLVIDRYFGSNMIYQTQFVRDYLIAERLIRYIYTKELNGYRIPNYNQCIYLNMSYECSKKLREQRKNKIDNSDTQDIYESNEDMMENVNRTGLRIANQFEWNIVDCNDENDNIYTIDSVAVKVFETIDFKGIEENRERNKRVKEHLGEHHGNNKLEL